MRASESHGAVHTAMRYATPMLAIANITGCAPLSGSRSQYHAKNAIETKRKAVSSAKATRFQPTRTVWLRTLIAAPVSSIESSSRTSATANPSLPVVG